MLWRDNDFRDNIKIRIFCSVQKDRPMNVEWDIRPRLDRLFLFYLRFLLCSEFQKRFYVDTALCGRLGQKKTMP